MRERWWLHQMAVCLLLIYYRYIQSAPPGGQAAAAAPMIIYIKVVSSRHFIYASVFSHQTPNNLQSLHLSELLRTWLKSSLSVLSCAVNMYAENISLCLSMCVCVCPLVMISKLQFWLTSKMQVQRCLLKYFWYLICALEKEREAERWRESCSNRYLSTHLHSYRAILSINL